MQTIKLNEVTNFVSKQDREDSLKNYLNYLTNIVRFPINSLSLSQQNKLSAKIAEIKDKLNKLNPEKMKNSIVFEQVIVDDATSDNEMYYLDLSKEKEEVEVKKNKASVLATTAKQYDEQYLNSLFERVTV